MFTGTVDKRRTGEGLSVGVIIRGSSVYDSYFLLLLFFIFYFFFLQRTKIWAKYSKDIETYVDKRAHLGEWLDLSTS